MTKKELILLWKINHFHKWCPRCNIIHIMDVYSRTEKYVIVGCDDCREKSENYEETRNLESAFARKYFGDEYEDMFKEK